MEYCEQEYKDYADIFDGGDEPEDETEEEKAERLKEDEKHKANSWNLFIYTLIQGDFSKLESILNSNYRMALWFKSVERGNKKIREYYDYGRYNIRDYSQQK
nr:hypothetical protein [uncultured Flavobacterium sp.]